MMLKTHPQVGSHINESLCHCLFEAIFYKDETGQSGQTHWPYAPCVSDIASEMLTVVTGVTFELFLYKRLATGQFVCAQGNIFYFICRALTYTVCSSELGITL